MSEQNPEFFKVYLPDFSSQRLHIPPAFIKYFNGTVPRKAILKGLSGKVWHVELEQVGKKLFINNGWQGFVTDNLLDCGDFLVFSYTEESIFNVRLFGKDGCKRENALAIVKTAPRVKIEEEPEAVQTDIRHPRACKRKFAETGLKRNGNLGSPEVMRQRRTAASITKNNKVLEPEPEEFVQPKNPHFVTFSSRTNRSRLYIPIRVLKMWNIQLKPAVKLHDQNGKVWPLGVTFASDGRIYFSSGWKIFRNHYKLRLQDKCLFEFILGRGKICNEVRIQIFPKRPRDLKNCMPGTNRPRP